MGRRLRDGSFMVKPDPVIQGGLEKCQEALDVYRRGVSAAEVVVALWVYQAYEYPSNSWAI